MRHPRRNRPALPSRRHLVSRSPFARTAAPARSPPDRPAARGVRTFVARNASKSLRGSEKGAPILELRLETQWRNAAAFGGLPFFGPPSILTDIVKQFTSDIRSNTRPHFAHVRRSPAMR